MLAHITGHSQRTEATSATTTFNLVKWIRARRLKWVGHILRMDDERLIKQTLHYIFHNPQDGDILMDVRATDCQHLLRQASDRDAWRRRVRNTAASSTTTWQQMSTTIATKKRADLIRKTRYHLSKAVMKIKIKKVKKKAQKLSNAKTREQFYRRYESKYEAHVAKTNFFKPRNADNKMKTSNMFHFSQRKITWESAKAVVFSCSSESEDSASVCKHISGENRTEGKALWLAAAGMSHIGNFHNNCDRDRTYNDSDEETSWAAAVDPAQYADCDRTPSSDDSQVQWAAAADPAAHEGCDNSMLDSHVNNNDTLNNSTESVIIFDPPPISGHHSDKQTANPNMTIL